MRRCIEYRMVRGMSRQTRLEGTPPTTFRCGQEKALEQTCDSAGVSRTGSARRGPTTVSRWTPGAIRRHPRSPDTTGTNLASIVG